MSKERKLTDTTDFREGPESDVKDNNKDPYRMAKIVPGHGQGGKGHGPYAEAEGEGGRPEGYGDDPDSHMSAHKNRYGGGYTR